MNDQIEPYAPKPGSLPWRLIKHLRESSIREMSRREIGVAMAVDNTGGLDTMLQLACSRNVLVRGRNSFGDLTWKLGEGPCILAPNRPIEETPAAPPAGSAPSPALVVISEPSVVAEPEVVLSGAPVEIQIVTLEPAPPQPVVPAPSAFSDKLSAFVRERVDTNKRKRGTTKKPRPASKPYLAAIQSTPLDDPANRETARYHAWLTSFGLGHSAVFRLAHMKDVEAAVGTFCAKTKARFRIAKLSQYRAGIERTA